MSRIQQYQASFTGGEMDPLLRGRTDLQQYYAAVALAENVQFEPQGGFSRRPGLRFLTDLSSDNPQNGVLLIPFEFSTTQNFMVVASVFATTGTIRFRFYANQVLLTNINGSGNSYLDYSVGTLYVVSAIDMNKTYFTQSADTLIITNENFAPFKIVRGANNTTWTASALSLTIPKTAFTLSKTSPSATLTATAVSGTTKVTAGSSVFASSNVDQFINVLNGFGRAKIVKYVSGTELEVVTEIPFFSTDAIASGDWELETGYEDSWSNTRGWPRTCSFHESRLYFGGSASEPATLFASKVSDFFNFKIAESLDDDAIKATLSTDSVNAITALRSGRDLQIFTTGAEFFVPQADLDPITPTNITIKSATRRGSKFGLRPQAAEGGTIFIQRQGKAVREMLFSDVELSYVANNISLLSSHMLVDPQRMALRNATDTTEGDLLLIVNGSDTTGYRASSVGFAGTMTAYTVNRAQNIVAPANWSTDGDFVDVGVDLDTVYCVVKRRNIGTDPISFSNVQIVLTSGSTAVKVRFLVSPATIILNEQIAIAGLTSNPSAFSAVGVDLTTINNTSQTVTDVDSTNNFVEINFTLGSGAGASVTLSTAVSGTISSSGTKYYLEVFDDDRTTDSAIQYFANATAPDQSLPGSTAAGSLSHLEDKTVKIVRDDIIDADQTVASGNVTLGGVPSSYAEVGLNYTVEVKTQPIEARLSSGSMQSTKRRILEVTPILFRSQNITINGKDIPLDPLPIPGTGGATSFTGVKKTQGFLGFDRDAQISISQSQPLFFTVLALDYKLSAG